MDIVEIIWTDAATTTHEGLLVDAAEETCMEAQSVGYLVKKSKELVTLAMTQFPREKTGKFFYHIPRGMIKEIRKLGGV